MIACGSSVLICAVDGYQDPNTSNNSSTATTQVSDSHVPPPDNTPPETTLTNTPGAFSGNVSPSFSFISSEGPPAFECNLDASTYQTCSSPKRLFLLSEGQHTFAVRAKDAANNVDETPPEYTWTVDSRDPKITFTQRPGNATGPRYYDEWVTDDRSPTWAWTVHDPNLVPETVSCDLDEGPPRYRQILYTEPCASPYTFEAELPDGNYSFEVAAEDKVYNYGYAYNDFEVDTVAPKVASVKPTGREVGLYADVVVTFDDHVYNSKQFVNIYRRGSNTPLDVWRDAYGKKIWLYLKNPLRRDTWYTVKVTGRVNDGANNLENPHTWFCVNFSCGTFSEVRQSTQPEISPFG
jgi:hypothetical protein